MSRTNTFWAYRSDFSVRRSWWQTELDGWSGGKSRSAETIDVSRRLSCREGFHPVVNGIPPERQMTQQDIELSPAPESNENGFLRVDSWSDYHRLRGVDMVTSIAFSPLDVPPHNVPRDSRVWCRSMRGSTYASSTSAHARCGC